MAMVAIGKFGTFKQAGPNNVPITNYLPRGTEMQFIQPLQVTPKFMQYLDDRIGPYPFASYGTVVLPKEVGDVNTLMADSAIETTAIPVFGFGGGKSEETLCHELTHQWLGDCVSITNWGDDIWWVEGFAHFSEWLLAEQTQGKAAYDRLAKSEYDQATASGTWLKPGHLTAQEMFGNQSYIGGALTFYALRRTLGDDKFFKTVRQFIDRNRYGNASAKDWIEAATQNAGRDMKPFFDTWLYGSMVPKLP
jgi:aminopeptidase N